MILRLHLIRLITDTHLSRDLIMVDSQEQKLSY